jgi:hypothetical protein
LVRETGLSLGRREGELAVKEYWTHSRMGLRYSYEFLIHFYTAMKLINFKLFKPNFIVVEQQPN